MGFFQNSFKLFSSLICLHLQYFWERYNYTLPCLFCAWFRDNAFFYVIAYQNEQIQASKSINFLQVLYFSEVALHVKLLQVETKRDCAFKRTKLNREKNVHFLGVDASGILLFGIFFAVMPVPSRGRANRSFHEYTRLTVIAWDPFWKLNFYILFAYFN